MKKVFFVLVLCMNMVSVQCMEKGPQCKDKETQAEPARQYFFDPIPISYIVKMSSAKRIVISGNRCCVTLRGELLHFFEDVAGKVTGYILIEADCYSWATKQQMRDSDAYALWVEAHRLGAR